KAGLSHMGEDIEQEGVVPSGLFDFLGHREASGMVTYDIGREPPQSCEVFGGGVLPGSVGVLGEDDIEDPMKPVLDAPMAADCVQQSFGGHVFGQQEVAHHRLLAALSAQTPT